MEDCDIPLVRLILGDRGRAQVNVGEHIMLYVAIFILGNMSVFVGVVDNGADSGEDGGEGEKGLMIE